MDFSEASFTDQDPIGQTTLDQMVSTDRCQLLKAAVPYLPPSGRQVISVYAKMQEFLNTAALFSSSGQEMQMCAAPEQNADPLSMLQDIRRYCYGESRRNLDQMINMMAVVQMMQLMRE